MKIQIRKITSRYFQFSPHDMMDNLIQESRDQSRGARLLPEDHYWSQGGGESRVGLFIIWYLNSP